MQNGNEISGLFMINYKILSKIEIMISRIQKINPNELH